MDIKTNSEVWRLENPKVTLFLPLKKKRNSLVGEILPSLVMKDLTIILMKFRQKKKFKIQKIINFENLKLPKARV
jgi:hypothetical protein